MRHFSGKLALVTGAGRGIGRLVAGRLAQRGARVIVTDVRKEDAESTCDEYGRHGRTLRPFSMDVTDGAVIEQVRKAVRDEFGAIDILVNNAGIVHGGAFLDVPMSAHRRTYEVNTLGLVAVTHAFLPDLVQREDACLVNVASASGFVGLPFGSTYASSKWSVIGFSESIRLELEELGHRHVHVTTVCPSYVATGMFEGARPPMLTPLLSPETVALRIVDAMERGEPFVLEPSLVKSIPLLRGLLPLGLFDRASRVLGLQDSMRHWRGRSSASD